mmetsp:Transcript_22324/g.54073  ORF Transcript_22324/g.54073 Transcript_22324/m.54073 type:complete len:85 (-) Transcript_22324:1848-2102(-)
MFFISLNINRKTCNLVTVRIFARFFHTPVLTSASENDFLSIAITTLLTYSKVAELKIEPNHLSLPLFSTLTGRRLNLSIHYPIM